MPEYELVEKTVPSKQKQRQLPGIYHQHSVFKDNDVENKQELYPRPD